MSIVRYEPLGLLNQFHDEIGRLFDQRENPARDWAPAVDIQETDKNYVIHADVPGIEPKEIDVTLEDGILTIKGERKWVNDQKEKEFRRVERSYGSFYRRFNLPDTANENGVSAKNKNGVLEIVIPKQEKVQPRRIEIKSN